MSLDELGEGGLVVLVGKLLEQASIALLVRDGPGDPAAQLPKHRVPLWTSHACNLPAAVCQRVYAGNRAVDYTFSTGQRTKLADTNGSQPMSDRTLSIEGIQVPCFLYGTAAGTTHAAHMKADLIVFDFCRLCGYTVASP